MKFIHSFRTRLFTGFLVSSLVPVLVCSSMLLQIFRLRLDSQSLRGTCSGTGADEEQPGLQ